jgi:hypothetical protein
MAALVHTDIEKGRRGNELTITPLFTNNAICLIAVY